MSRNLLVTKAALGLYAFAIAVITPNFPTVSREATAVILRHAPPDRQVDISSAIAVISALLGTGLGLASKYASGDYYTPKGIPGQDPPAD